MARKWISRPTSGSVTKGASPDFPGAWIDVSNMWPTGLGSYAVVNPYASGSNISASGETSSSLVYAFAATTPSGSIGYAIGAKIWEVAAGGGSLTDRTNGRTIGSAPHMAQFGNATVCAMGTANPVIAATGGNFSNAATVPQCEILLSCANALLCLNTSTDTDGWSASDLFDYTNHSTGEFADGRLLATPGPIVGGCVYRNLAYVFKQGSIWVGRYVGGDEKWIWEVACWHMGMSEGAVADRKYSAVACKDGIAFLSKMIGTDAQIHFFDGVNPPVHLNPETRIATTDRPIFTYDPVKDRLVITGTGNQGNAQHFYSFTDQAWGRGVTTTNTHVVQGNAIEVAKHYVSSYTTRPPRWRGSNNNLALDTESTPEDTSVTAYVESSAMGKRVRKTTFRRLVPILRARANKASGGSPSMALSYSTFSEPHDTTATATQAVTESGSRDRFDFVVTDTCATFKLTFTDMYADIEDIAVDMVDAGAE